MPRRSSKKDSPAKLAGRMKRRWRVVLLRSKGEILGEVEAPDVAAAKAAAAVQFDLDEVQRNPSWCKSLGKRVERSVLWIFAVGSLRGRPLHDLALGHGLAWLYWDFSDSAGDFP